MRAASLGATPLSQAGQQAQAKEYATPRESGVGDAGLRRASMPPHSKTLSRESGAPDRQNVRQYPFTECHSGLSLFALGRYVGLAVVGAADHALHGLELVVHGVVEGVAAGFGGVEGAAGEGGGFFHRGCGCRLGGRVEGLFDQPDAAAEGQDDEEKRGAGRRGIAHNACLNAG